MGSRRNAVEKLVAGLASADREILGGLPPPSSGGAAPTADQGGEPEEDEPGELTLGRRGGAGADGAARAALAGGSPPTWGSPAVTRASPSGGEATALASGAALAFVWRAGTSFADAAIAIAAGAVRREGVGRAIENGTVAYLGEVTLARWSAALGARADGGAGPVGGAGQRPEARRAVGGIRVAAGNVAAYPLPAEAARAVAVHAAWLAVVADEYVGGA